MASYGPWYFHPAMVPQRSIPWGEVEDAIILYNQSVLLDEIQVITVWGGYSAIIVYNGIIQTIVDYDPTHQGALERAQAAIKKGEPQAQQITWE